MNHGRLFYPQPAGSAPRVHEERVCQRRRQRNLQWKSSTREKTKDEQERKQYVELPA